MLRMKKMTYTDFQSFLDALLLAKVSKEEIALLLIKKETNLNNRRRMWGLRYIYDSDLNSKETKS